MSSWRHERTPATGLFRRSAKRGERVRRPRHAFGPEGMLGPGERRQERRLERHVWRDRMRGLRRR